MPEAFLCYWEQRTEWEQGMSRMSSPTNYIWQWTQFHGIREESRWNWSLQLFYYMRIPIPCPLMSIMNSFLNTVHRLHCRRYSITLQSPLEFSLQFRSTVAFPTFLKELSLTRRPLPTQSFLWNSPSHLGGMRTRETVPAHTSSSEMEDIEIHTNPQCRWCDLRRLSRCSTGWDRHGQEQLEGHWVCLNRQHANVELEDT